MRNQWTVAKSDRVSDDPGLLGRGQLRLPVKYQHLFWWHDLLQHEQRRQSLRIELSDLLGRKDLLIRQLYLLRASDGLRNQRLHQCARQRQQPLRQLHKDVHRQPDLQRRHLHMPKHEQCMRFRLHCVRLGPGVQRRQLRVSGWGRFCLQHLPFMGF